MIVGSQCATACDHPDTGNAWSPGVSRAEWWNQLWLCLPSKCSNCFHYIIHTHTQESGQKLEGYAHFENHLFRQQRNTSRWAVCKWSCLSFSSRVFLLFWAKMGVYRHQNTVFWHKIHWCTDALWTDFLTRPALSNRVNRPWTLSTTSKSVKSEVGMSQNVRPGGPQISVYS